MKKDGTELVLVGVTSWGPIKCGRSEEIHSVVSVSI